MYKKKRCKKDEKHKPISHRSCQKNITRHNNTSTCVTQFHNLACPVQNPFPIADIEHARQRPQKLERRRINFCQDTLRRIVHGSTGRRIRAANGRVTMFCSVRQGNPGIFLFASESPTWPPTWNLPEHILDSLTLTNTHTSETKTTPVGVRQVIWYLE